MNCSKLVPIIVFLCVCVLIYSQEENRDTKQHPELTKLVRQWASKLGGEMWHFGELVTRKNKVKDSFKDTTVVVENGHTLLKSIQEELSAKLRQKVEAVKRIMNVAEERAKAQKESDIDINFQFYNGKNLTNLNEEPDTSASTTTKEPEIEVQELQDDSFISENFREYRSIKRIENFSIYQRDQSDSPEEAVKEEENFDSESDSTESPEKDPQASQAKPVDKSKLLLISDRNFYDIPVNTNHSAVHVPSYVYERSKDVIAGIKWSELLDETFRDNYKNDPTMSWQYFGSSTGFMRYFPAMIWSQEPIDLFDTRTRTWYIEAASSPKDVVILVDRSGSMTGMRREIARHVVHNILDTLGNNDYVNIFTFSNTTEPLVECFENQLVQANLANIRAFKESMDNFKTEQIANFSLALITAFELLQEYREQKIGAQCNQAIMLITDGVQYNFKEIFEKYNWGNLPFMNVRVFTYLIGREVSDVREVKWMACANQGYYVHLSTYAEVREEVLHYIPVMARPMVLDPTNKPEPTWSPVYADVTDPKLTNWLWVNRARNKQRERYRGWEKLKAIMKKESGQVDMRLVKNIKEFFFDLKPSYKDPETQPYHLMTSVSVPVYDLRPRQERVANLLGVAGTDVPIELIQKYLVPYRLGVNGYAFIVTNNGYILTHPDLRPVYKGILKPAYNRVDVVEVEILNDDSEPRNFSESIKEFRRKIVMQEEGNATFKVKQHLDEMRRIMLLNREYYYMGINGTPFSLVISLPQKYGSYKIEHPVESDIRRIRLNDRRALKEYFDGNWTIHPDWHYCRYLDKRIHFKSPEQEFMHFLDRIDGPGWKWSECDRRLTCKLVADASITNWFNQNITTSTKEENGAELVKKIGIVVAFLATHSGLTRWQNFPQNFEDSPDYRPNFEKIHNRAIDEVWYKRAVEQHYVDPSNYVYSVPHEAGNASDTLVTVSHAIFLREDKKEKAPAAVVGYQFFHSALQSLFTKITSSCGDMTCKRTCESQELHCLLLDDNGYIVVSNNPQETGHFFGKIRSDIMGQLVEENIYKTTVMYDYQGLCTEYIDSSSPASSLFSPIEHLRSLLSWTLSTLLLLTRGILGDHIVETISDGEDIGQMPTHREHIDSPESDIRRISDISDTELIMKFAINKTKPEPCDKQFYIYSLVHYTERNISSSGYNKSMTDCSRPYIVQRVSGSNMVMLVINRLCIEDPDIVIESPDHIQVDYNMSLHCYRALYNDFPRRRYMSCINRNVNESEIKLCGKGNNISPFNFLLLILVAVTSYLYMS